MKKLDLKFWSNKMPKDLEMKVLSYLYFSSYVSNKIKYVIHCIKSYNTVQLTYLYSKYDTTMVSYFVLKYFMYDEISSVKLELDYNMLAKPPIIQYEEITRIFLNLRPVDSLRIIKYIEQKGWSSEVYAY
uniref:Uncharacterized protein n=1 Tax=viral metagenome TaxID=1070528 RepID=A0A6C0KX48_9ZZZZ